MTPDELAKIEARCAKATPGPWDAPLVDLGSVQSFKAVDFYFDHSYEAYPPLGEAGPVYVANSEENAEFIAAARTDVPALIAALRAAQGRESELSILLREAYEYTPECTGIAENIAGLFPDIARPRDLPQGRKLVEGTQTKKTARRTHGGEGP
jgi:hypothetical protein